MDIQNSKKWVDVDELALYLNCSKSTIYHKVSTGLIPYTKKIGLRFYLPDDDRWLLDDDYYHPEKVTSWIEKSKKN